MLDAAERCNAISLTAADTVKRLDSDFETGLTVAQVERRRAVHGWNQLAAARPDPTWKRLLAQFKELVIWILIVAAVLAGVMGEWLDTLAILAIVVVNGVLGFLQEERAERALTALRAMSSPTAKVRRDGALQTVAAKELVPGDIVQLEAGDNIPADARLLESFAVTVQEASLTGESLPVDKNAKEMLADDTPLGDRSNSVFMGTVFASGKATAIVVATGMQTELGGIAGLLRQSQSEPTPLQRRLAELGRILAGVCLVLVAIIFTVQYLRSGALMETLLIALSLAVAAVPEGLPAVVTIALALGLQRMVKRNALIRKLPSVETLGSVTVVCTDKTGTLTRNEMTVRELWIGDRGYSVSGSGYRPHGEFKTHSRGDGDGSAALSPVQPLEDRNLMQAVAIAANCNNASVVRDAQSDAWQVVGDPTEGALIVMAMKAGWDPKHQRPSIIHEIPFDSERKTMSVIARQADARLVMYTKGAPEVILEKCSREMHDGQPRQLSAERRKAIQEENSRMAGRALRVLGLAYRNQQDPSAVDFQEEDLVFAGLVGMIDPPREEAKTAVSECHSAGIRPVMITGDHPETALAIARELTIATSDQRAVTGRQLDGLSDQQLTEAVTSIAVYARVSAAHKLRVVAAWKRKGEIVAMTGDGVNDAPAIKSADIGIAMGITGTDVTKEAADMVLTDDNFSSIVNAIKEGRGIFDNIQKFVHYLLSCNAGEVLLMFAAAVMGLPVPLIAIQILWINLVTDGLPALALAMEPPERDIMQRQPRPPKEPVITTRRGLLILIHGTLIAASALAGFWWAHAADPTNPARARSTAFAITAFSQLAFAFVCRSHRDTLPQLGAFSNPWLFAAVAFSTLLQIGVLTLPFARSIFDGSPPEGLPWLMIIVLSIVPATVIELAKIVRSMAPRTTATRSN